MSGGGLFLMKRLSNYVDTKVTRRYLLDTAVFLKKGNFNTPSVFRFFKRQTAALIDISKPPLDYLHLIKRIKTLPLNNGFFYLPLTWGYIYNLGYYLLKDFNHKHFLRLFKRSIVQKDTASIFISKFSIKVLCIFINSC